MQHRDFCDLAVLLLANTTVQGQCCERRHRILPAPRAHNYMSISVMEVL